MSDLPTGFWGKLGQLVISPSYKVIVIALLVLTMPFLAGMVYISPTSFSQSVHKYTAKTSKDVRVFGYARAAALSVDQIDTPKIVMIGSSSMQAAFDSNIMEDQVRAELGKDVQVYNLAVDSQTILEFIGMVEHIPAGTEGVLVLKVSPISLTRNYSSVDMHKRLKNPDRFTLRSTMMDRSLNDLGIRDTISFDNFFLNNLATFCARYKHIAKNIVLTKGFTPEHVYLNEEYVGQDHWNKQGMRAIRALSTYEENKGANFDYIRVITDYVRQNTKMEIVLLEQLYSPRLFDEYIEQGFYDRYLVEMTVFADALDITYINLPGKLQFRKEDFRDWTHINSAEAIDRASRELVSAVYSSSPDSQESL